MLFLETSRKVLASKFFTRTYYTYKYDYCNEATYLPRYSYS
jgi:hypothetical protein